MKYLRRYNESTKSLDDIHDICLELTDIGLSVDITPGHLLINRDFSDPGLPDFTRQEQLPWEDDESTDFKFTDVKDCVLRLIDYLGDDLKLIFISTDCGDFEYHNTNNPISRNIKDLEIDDIEGEYIFEIRIDYRI